MFAPLRSKAPPPVSVALAERSKRPPDFSSWAERRIRSAWQPGQAAPAFVSEALRSPSFQLESAGLEAKGLGPGFQDIRIHTGAAAAESAARLGAAAYAAGNHIIFAPGQYAPHAAAGRHLLAHELAHVSQQPPGAGLPTRMNHDPSAERLADAQANGWVNRWTNSWSPGQPGAIQPPALSASWVMPSIAEKILKWAAKKLEKGEVRTISKHIARHARQIADRAVHSIFKHPRQIRALVTRTVEEATEIAGRHAAAGTERIVEEGGIRITRQATGTPGKFRILIQKVFDKEIGTQGERILRIVLDQSGRIVTAFPADRLVVIGLTVAGVEALTAGSAKAGGLVQDQVEREAKQKEREDNKVDVWDWIPYIGDIWGGDLNSGESEALAARDADREIERVIQETIQDIEETEQRSFSPEHRQEIEDLIRTAISTPVIMNDPEE